MTAVLPRSFPAWPEDGPSRCPVRRPCTQAARRRGRPSTRPPGRVRADVTGKLGSIGGHGLDPRQEADRKRYARLVVHPYMERHRDMVEAAHRDKPAAGVWFNSRPKANLFEERMFLRYVRIEALPTGGWGYSSLPYVARDSRGRAGHPRGRLPPGRRPCAYPPGQAAPPVRSQVLSRRLGKRNS